MLIEFLLKRMKHHFSGQLKEKPNGIGSKKDTYLYSGLCSIE